ncbi:hypothetical protein Taro_052909, partial [Colocasia esculenta]|nr:hypothetical protein [Colocasia esculenta]
STPLDLRWTSPRIWNPIYRGLLRNTNISTKSPKYPSCLPSLSSSSLFLPHIVAGERLRSLEQQVALLFHRQRNPILLWTIGSNGCWAGHSTAPQEEAPVPLLLSSSVLKQGQEGFGSAGAKSLKALALIGAGVSGILSFGTIASADEAEHGLACPSYPWPHKGILSSYDHASIRRGHQVYQQVCASCHSMSLISFRDLVGVAYTEEETKAMAAEIEVVDGPNDEGEMFTRPGKLSDRFPQPYANEQAARFANGGAYPPDLSLITKARHNGQNYVFALLTGYRDPPAGVSIREGLHYNPYFPGGAIAMPKMLIDGALEYEDGTPATESQMGKDVITFLSWAAEPEMEERKLMGFKWMFVLSLALLQAAYYRRMKWSIFKSRKLVVDVVN